MSSTENDVEARLASLFERQAAGLPGVEREWTGPAYAGAPPQRRRRPLLVGAAALIPVVLVAAVLAVVAGSEDDDQAAGAPPMAPAVEFQTNQVSMTAGTFAIDIDGTTFTTAAPVDVAGDPGSPEHTTLEVEWTERDLQMRFYIYFTSDGREWWSNEIRTYDGRQRGDWITYTGEFFRSPLGSPFSGDLDITASDRGITGRVRIGDLRLEAFRPPASCATATGQYVLDLGTDRITMAAGPSVGYGVRAEVLDAASCEPVSADGFSFAWTADDPGLLTVEPGGPRADLQAAELGSTVLRVTARGVGGGAVVAETAIDVVISELYEETVETTMPPG